MLVAFRARYVFPLAAPPVADGVVCLDGEQIASCGREMPSRPAEVIDLGNAAILPGFVNAHAHLDYGDLDRPLGHRGIRFVDWLRLVMERRGRRERVGCVARSAPHPEENLAALAAMDPPRGKGLAESLRSGVATLVDIVASGEESPAAPCRVLPFVELIAPTADRVDAALKTAESHLAARSVGKAERGLAPHAPYSVHPALLAEAVELARRRRAPVAMHLAESPEEIEWLATGGGPLRAFLEEIGAWDATARRPDARPMDDLRLLARAPRALVVHGAYLNAEEIAFLAANSNRMSVVYCPRSSAWFGHRAYPLEKLLAAGVRVALGTDGRGSSPNLNMLDEMRFAAVRHPGAPKHVILEMATLAGASALGLEESTGSLSPGKAADLAVVALPDREAPDPHELLFDPEAKVVGYSFSNRLLA